MSWYPKHIHSLKPYLCGYYTTSLINFLKFSMVHRIFLAYLSGVTSLFLYCNQCKLNTTHHQGATLSQQQIPCTNCKSAQSCTTREHPYHSPSYIRVVQVVWACSKGQTDTHRHTGDCEHYKKALYISRCLRLMRNVNRRNETILCMELATTWLFCRTAINCLAHTSTAQTTARKLRFFFSYWTAVL